MINTSSRAVLPITTFIPRKVWRPWQLFEQTRRQTQGCESSKCLCCSHCRHVLTEEQSSICWRTPPLPSEPVYLSCHTSRPQIQPATLLLLLLLSFSHSLLSHPPLSFSLSVSVSQCHICWKVQYYKVTPHTCTRGRAHRRNKCCSLVRFGMCW